jgi:hypothetical protein
MSNREFLRRPKEPSRQHILDTMGDQGESRWRNPVHLPEITGKWPKRTNTEEGEERKYISQMEMVPGTWNGSIK